MFSKDKEIINLSNMMVFRNIFFDEWTEDEYGIWVTMCPSCINRYASRVSDVLDDHGTGCCSVKGCTQEDSNATEMRYVNLKTAEAVFFTGVHKSDVHL